MTWQAGQEARVIAARSFTTVPWKNGGGVTHEIARDGRAPFGWRLSVAEVERDGAFSLFPGYRRWLTVITGHGMTLAEAAGGRDALPLVPVHFPGEAAIMGLLVDGPCRDFNLIYDPQLFEAHMTCAGDTCVGDHDLVAGGAGETSGALVVAGHLHLRDAVAEAGDFAFFGRNDDAHLAPQSRVVQITLRPLSK